MSVFLGKDKVGISFMMQSMGLEYETGTYTPASDTARATISFSKTHSKPPVWILLVDTSTNLLSTQNSLVMWEFYDVYRFNGTGYQYDTSTYRPAMANWRYYGTSSYSTGSQYITYNSDSTTTTSSTYTRYWADVDKFMPYGNNQSRYWRSGRTYKWIAVWAPTT